MISLPSVACIAVLTAVLIATAGAIPARAQAPAAQSRITQAIDESNLVTLHGNTHPLARAQYDQGAAPDNLPAERIQLLLQRSPAQESALRQLLDEQKSASSPNYHQWLTPAQFGQQFGPSDADIATVTAWLQSHGFTVNRVSNGRTLIEVTGTAGAVREAFHTEIHKYVVNGESHWANNSDPQIPAALAPILAGPVTLHNFGRKAMHVVGGKIQMTKPSGNATKPDLTGQCTDPSGEPFTCYVVAPADFATIYNTQNLYSSGIDGTNQTIAIVGDSNINCADVTNFRTDFALPVSAAQANNDCTQTTSNVQIILDGPDPGINGDEIEADLDVEWSGAVAKGAHIDFVPSEQTEVSQGIDLSAEYIIDNDLAPVMSESFGDCEARLGNSGNAFYSVLWEQAAAEGITVMVSSGDSGAAGCDNDNSQGIALDGLAVSGISSTPFNVSVGGTDFGDTGNQTTYWSPEPNSGNTPGTPQMSVKGYVPEIPWDDSCANIPTIVCNGLSPGNGNTPIGLVNIVGGGGGQSNCTTVSANTCKSGYPKPSWQEGAAVAGLAMSDNVRDMPDVSLFAASGSSSNSFYPVCELDVKAKCTDGSFIGVGGTSSSSPAFAGIMAMVDQFTGSRQGNANYELYSLASLQVTNLPSGGCNSASISTPTGACTFYDITTGSNSVPCVGGFGCTNQNGSAVLGVLDEYNTTTGLANGILAWQAGQNYTAATGAGAYSPAIGLGSVNAFNLVHNWTFATTKFTASQTTLALSCTSGDTACQAPAGPTPLTLTHGQSVTAAVGVVKLSACPPSPASCTPTGAAVLLGTPNPNAVTDASESATAAVDVIAPAVGNFDVYPLVNGSVSDPTSYLSGGQYAVKAHYGGDGTFGASDSAPINVVVNPENSKSSLTAYLYTPTTAACENVNACFVQFNSGATMPYGSLELFRMDVVGSISNEETATGQVTFTDAGTPLLQFSPTTGPSGPSEAFSLNSAGYAEFQTPTNGIFTPATQISAYVVGPLSVTTHSIQGTYLGTNTSFVANSAADASYNQSQTAAFALTVAKAATTIAVEPLAPVSNSAPPCTTGAPSTFTVGASVTVGALIGTQSFGNVPSGSVAFVSSKGESIPSATSIPFYDQRFDFSELCAYVTYKPTGTETVTATYVGDQNYAAPGASAQVTLTAGSVAAAGTSTVTASPTSVVADGSTTSTITVTLEDVNSNPVSGKVVTLAPSGGTSTISAASGTSSASGAVTFTVKDAFAETVIYTATDSTDGVAITQTASVTFTAGTAFTFSSSPNNTQALAATISAPGASGHSTLGVTLAGGTNSVTLSFALLAAPVGATDLPSCSFSPNPDMTAGASTVTMTCTTTAASEVPPAPTARPNLPRAPIGWMLAAFAAALAVLMLLRLPERKRGYALLVFVLVFAAGAGVACGGGGGGGIAGGGGNPGTTVGFYEYNVSGAPAGGTTTVWFNVE
jgi:hypothetical protein